MQLEALEAALESAGGRGAVVAPVGPGALVAALVALAKVRAGSPLLCMI